MSVWSADMHQRTNPLPPSFPGMGLRKERYRGFAPLWTYPKRRGSQKRLLKCERRVRG